MTHRLITKNDIGKCASLFCRVFSAWPWNEPWAEDGALKRLSHFYESKGFFWYVI